MRKHFLPTIPFGVGFHDRIMVGPHARHAISTPGPGDIPDLPAICDREASHR